MQTPIITYNLKERGRRFRGKERNFNIRAIVNAINSPACQERVKNRDMLGYYGHWPRIKFGLNPAEGGLEGGKPAFVEPALVTTLLRASLDGTLEHQAEFLGTTAGQVAAKLFNSRTGGFSSAIDELVPEFFGFDYVLEPNYSTNRGYTLDDVRGMTLDDIEAAIYDENARGLMRLLDSAHAERDQANHVIERLSAENEELLSLLSQSGRTPDAVFDSARGPIVTPQAPFQRMQRDIAFFGSAALPSVVNPDERKQAQPKMPDLYQRMMSRFS